ncbi:MarR family winged helix-turn-helix transcriptional regulator [Pontiella agarivorans]|uniref:MarR family transcriptional regulator n=1 Tax=Pontiella agarivorans TaxID=3038953 RepID=A0ABU5MUL1_9BACT|nr:MarR family transcriptional regulator [Pontiella agarivorans]MDZ8117656.1 MarR family transcriptional regulator [Pontiella agarivorans]
MIFSESRGQTEGQYLYLERVRKALRKISHAEDVYSKKLDREFGVTLSQLICLYTLHQHGRLTLAELANDVHLGPSTVHGIVKRLQRKGWVQQYPDALDQRKRYLQLTETGRHFAEKSIHLLARNFSEALHALSPLEQTTLMASLNLMARQVGSEIPLLITPEKGPAS